MSSVKQSPKILSLYLSTQTPAGSVYAPVDTNNFSIITWNINWNQLYGGYGADLPERLARVRFNMRSLSQTGVLTDAINTGVLAIQGIGNKYSNSQNGLTLGEIHPVNDPLAGGNHLIFGNTLDTNGVQCYLPEGYSPLTVLFLDRTGALMTGVNNYQIILEFDLNGN